MEQIFVLLGIALLLWTLACLIGLPINAVAQSRRISKLAEQLRQLEERLPGARPEAKPIVLRAPAQVATEEPALAEVVPERVPTPLVPAEPIGAALEAWIGRRGLGWVAVVLLLFAAAFFLKQVFENRWIGETGRVAIGVLAGLGLCGAGLRYHHQGWRIFSQMLTAGGVVLLYLSAFGAFGYYHLLPREHASVFLVALVAESALLAVLYDAPAIAIMALVGALLAPPLLRTDQDQYRSLFLYLATVDIGVLAVLVYRPWPALGTLALLGTHGLFWSWYDIHFHPEKLVAAVCFQLGVFVLFLAYSLTSHLLRRRKASIEDLIRLVLNAALFFAALYVLLDDDYHVWMGTLAILTAIMYAALGAIVLLAKPEDDRHFLVAAAVAMGFVATAIPLQTDAVWIALGWAVEGVILWWFGLRVRMGLLRGMGTALLLVAVGRLLFFDTPEAHRDVFVPLLNDYAMPAVAVAVCLLAAATAAWRFRNRLTGFDRGVAWLAGLGGLVLVWFILSFETYDYFIVRIQRPSVPYSAEDLAAVDQQGRPLQQVHAEQATVLRRTAQTALSIVWAIYAALVLALGFRLRNRAVRWMALALFAVTLGKVLLVDMAGLPGFYRVATFFALAVMMAVAAWAYQRWQVNHPTDKQEVTEYGSL